MISIVLIGGPSGIGKSTLVNAIIKSDQRFRRPISFTTRAPRNSDPQGEYEYLTVEEFQKRRFAGEFVTVDYIYGNLYSMSYISLLEMSEQGCIAIKEIHPNNHAKLKQFVSGSTSVLLLPESLNEWFETEAIKRASDLPLQSRIREDKAYYTRLNPTKYPFDISLRAKQGEHIDEISSRLLTALTTVESPSHSDSTRIEEVNVEGYDKLAAEFSDTKRPTTANYHDLSAAFFAEQLDLVGKRNGTALDIGAGQGFLLPKLCQRFDKVAALDLSERMLELISAQWPTVATVHGSAFHLPFENESLQVVVASLADPFLNRASLLEVRRVLVDGGAFIFSTPSRTCSDAIRQANSSPAFLTTFINATGQETSVYSFTYSDDELRSLLSACGFSITKFAVAHGRDLDLHARPISPALQTAARQLGMTLAELPIVQLVSAGVTA